MPKPVEKKDENYDTPEDFRKLFKRIKKPGDEPPTMPHDIAVMNWDAISNLQSHYSAWREYTEDLMVETLVAITNAKQEYDNVYDPEYILTQGKNKEERDIKVRQNPKVRRKAQELEQAELMHELLGKKLESFNNCLATISREITRRSNTPTR